MATETSKIIDIETRRQPTATATTKAGPELRLVVSYADGRIRLTPLLKEGYSMGVGSDIAFADELGFHIVESKSMPRITGTQSRALDDILRSMWETSASAEKKGDDEMPETDWMRVLIEKMDMDRRESIERTEAAIQRIEDKLEATRKDVADATQSLNSRMDQIYIGIRQESRAAMWSAISVAITVFLAFIGTMVTVLQLARR